MEIYIKQIPAINTHPLRISELDYMKIFETASLPEDEHATTLHLGAFILGDDNNQPIGILSCIKKKLNINLNTLSPQSHYQYHDFNWELLGLAVKNSFKHNNIGSLLLTELQNRLMETETKIGLWGNARSNAIEFFIKNGFHTTGDVFTIIGAGDHYEIIKIIN